MLFSGDLATNDTLQKVIMILLEIMNLLVLEKGRSNNQFSASDIFLNNFPLINTLHRYISLV